jgi:hypothetical protein
VQDKERIGKLGYRYWSIDMFVESTGSGTVSCRFRYFELNRPLRGKFALAGDLPISCNIKH